MGDITRPDPPAWFELSIAHDKSPLANGGSLRAGKVVAARGQGAVGGIGRRRRGAVGFDEEREELQSCTAPCHTLTTAVLPDRAMEAFRCVMVSGQNRESTGAPAAPAWESNRRDLVEGAARLIFAGRRFWIGPSFSGNQATVMQAGRRRGRRADGHPHAQYENGEERTKRARSTSLWRDSVKSVKHCRLPSLAPWSGSAYGSAWQTSLGQVPGSGLPGSIPRVRHGRTETDQRQRRRTASTALLSDRPPAPGILYAREHADLNPEEVGMWSRRLAAVMACMAMGAPMVLAPGAAAKSKPPHLLSLKACNTVLGAADFRDELEEVGKPEIFPSAESSTCFYGGLEADGPSGGARLFPVGKVSLGDECFLNFVKKEGAVPPGFCFRLAHANLVIARGPAVNRVAGKLKKGVKAKFWPAGFTRTVLHTVGDRAEIGSGPDGRGYGYLQVLNAQLTVEVTEMGVFQVLEDAAALL
jgi:hypothetical protein